MLLTSCHNYVTILLSLSGGLNFSLMQKGGGVKKEFIAYAGEKLIIEWYFDNRDKSQGLDYFEKLPKARQNKIFYLFRWLGNSGKILNQKKFRYEGDKIYALKVSQDRFLCFFFDGNKVIITNAYQKKTAKMPPKEKEKSLNARKNYIDWCKEGRYYE